MPKAKPLSKQQILGAVNKTKSNRASARYLGVSYIHYKKWAKNYDATEEGYENLFEQHKNQSGKGIPKFLNGGKKTPAIVDIIEGFIYFSFDPVAAEAILFYIYSRYDMEENLIPFIDDEGKEHLMANAEDLWEYLVYLTDKLMSTQ